jgi:hypothetical protein
VLFCQSVFEYMDLSKGSDQRRLFIYIHTKGQQETEQSSQILIKRIMLQCKL